MKYTNDKKHTVTLRLNDRQYYYLKGSAEAYGVSPSYFLRLVIDMVQNQEKKGRELSENFAPDSNNQF